MAAMALAQGLDRQMRCRPEHTIAASCRISMQQMRIGLVPLFAMTFQAMLQAALLRIMPV
jgi:hypothetical protein